MQQVFKFGFNWVFGIFALFSWVEPEALAPFYVEWKVLTLCFALFYAGLGSEVEPIKIRSNLNDLPFLDHVTVQLITFVCELTAARHEIAKVDVKMKSAVCKQANSGLVDLALAVFVHHWNKLLDSSVTSSFNINNILCGVCESHWLEMNFAVFYFIQLQKGGEVCLFFGDNQAGGVLVNWSKLHRVVALENLGKAKLVHA